MKEDIVFNLIHMNLFDVNTVMSHPQPLAHRIADVKGR